MLRKTFLFLVLVCAGMSATLVMADDPCRSVLTQETKIPEQVTQPVFVPQPVFVVITPMKQRYFKTTTLVRPIIFPRLHGFFN